MVLSRDDMRTMVLPLMERFNVKEAFLFGSYARGDAGAESDIDLLIVGGADFRPLDLFGFAEELHRQSGKPVGVYERSELLSGPFKDAVMRETVRL